MWSLSCSLSYAHETRVICVIGIDEANCGFDQAEDAVGEGEQEA
jgi:hypothetical protein